MPRRLQENPGEAQPPLQPFRGPGLQHLPQGARQAGAHLRRVPQVQDAQDAAPVSRSLKAPGDAGVFGHTRSKEPKPGASHSRGKRFFFPDAWQVAATERTEIPRGSLSPAAPWLLGQVPVLFVPMQARHHSHVIKKPTGAGGLKIKQGTRTYADWLMIILAM